MDQSKKLELVKEMLELSGKKGLTAECVLTIINILQHKPSSSVGSVLAETLDIWDCFPEPVKLSDLLS
jgi:hypothetical protein